MKRLIPLVVLLIVGIAIYRSHLPPQARAQLKYSGVVEVTTVDESFEISGRLIEVKVREGESVKKGQELARLDDALAVANLKQAKARAGTAQAKLDQLLAGSRPEEIAQAEARAQQAQADLEQLRNGPTAPELQAVQAQMAASRERASLLQEGYRQEDIAAATAQRQAAASNLQTWKAEYQRAVNLSKEGAISLQQLESKKNSYDQALAAFNSAQENANKLQRGPRPTEIAASLQDFQANKARRDTLAQGTRPELISKAEAVLAERQQAVQLAHQGPRREEIAAARQQLLEAKSALEAAQVSLNKTHLLASGPGTVLARNFEPGEAINPGQSVIAVADVAHPWVNIYIPEYELPKVQLDQAGKVSADGLDQPLNGKIVRIFEKSEFTPKFIQTERERVNLVYKAKFAFDNPQLRLRGGMPADVDLAK